MIWTDCAFHMHRFFQLADGNEIRQPFWVQRMRNRNLIVILGRSHALAGDDRIVKVVGQRNIFGGYDRSVLSMLPAGKPHWFLKKVRAEWVCPNEISHSDYSRVNAEYADHSPINLAEFLTSAYQNADSFLWRSEWHQTFSVLPNPKFLRRTALPDW